MQQVIHLKGQCGIVPCLIDRCVPYNLIWVCYACIAIAACITNISSYIPVFRQMEGHITCDYPVAYMALALVVERVAGERIDIGVFDADIYQFVGKA